MQYSMCDVPLNAENGRGLQLENDVENIQFVIGERPLVDGGSERVCLRIPITFLPRSGVSASPVVLIFNSPLNTSFTVSHCNGSQGCYSLAFRINASYDSLFSRNVRIVAERSDSASRVICDSRQARCGDA
jgi:hypothetical protein